MKKYLLFNIVVISLVIAMLLSGYYTKISAFKDYHLSIANEATTSVTEHISRFINEKKRLVSIFGNENLTEIATLAHQPDDLVLHEKLRAHIALYFPDFFAFTIAKNDGHPFIEDFDGLIGDLCLSDISHYADTSEQSIRIHPHPEVYHFDIISKLQNDKNNLLLFISFDADIIGNLLHNIQLPGHQLILVLSDLIEVTEKGARINIDRNDYRLSEHEKNRILVSKPVPGTQWHIIDMHEPSLFHSYSIKTAITNLYMLLAFIVVIALMTYFLYREEKRRLDAERHKDDFVSIINHELRTPITSIQGTLSLVANGVTGELSEKTQQMVDIALSNSERLKLLINDILDLKKFSAGKIEIDRQTVRLDEFIKKTVYNYQGYEEKYGVHYQLGHIEAGIKVDIDINRMTQAITNLLSNAAKYGAEHDTIMIDLDTHDGFARISITDHGEGISEEFKKRIFQKFSQSSISNHKGGTGLGLNIVKLIIEAHGGHVDYKRLDDSATVFFILLPLSRI